MGGRFRLLMRSAVGKRLIDDFIVVKAVFRHF